MSDYDRQDFLKLKSCLLIIIKYCCKIFVKNAVIILKSKYTFRFKELYFYKKLKNLKIKNKFLQYSATQKLQKNTELS